MSRSLRSESWLALARTAYAWSSSRSRLVMSMPIATPMTRDDRSACSSSLRCCLVRSPSVWSSAISSRSTSSAAAILSTRRSPMSDRRSAWSARASALAARTSEASARTSGASARLISAAMSAWPPRSRPRSVATDRHRRGDARSCGEYAPHAIALDPRPGNKGTFILRVHTADRNRRGEPCIAESGHERMNALVRSDTAPVQRASGKSSWRSGTGGRSRSIGTPIRGRSPSRYGPARGSRGDPRHPLSGGRRVGWPLCRCDPSHGGDDRAASAWSSSPAMRHVGCARRRWGRKALPSCGLHVSPWGPRSPHSVQWTRRRGGRRVRGKRVIRRRSAGSGEGSLARLGDRSVRAARPGIPR